jgi:hypothetical protein
MIDVDIIQAVASVLGVIVAAIGFYFVSRQLRKSAHSDIYALGIATKQALLEHPDLRKYFFDNIAIEEIRDKEEKNRVMTLADMFCLYLEQIAIYAKDLGGEKEAWFGYIKEMYGNSPIIRQYLERSLYASALYDVIGKEHSGISSVQTDTT